MERESYRIIKQTWSKNFQDNLKNLNYQKALCIVKKLKELTAEFEALHYLMKKKRKTSPCMKILNDSPCISNDYKS